MIDFNIKLTDKTTYKELKEWYLSIMDELPSKLDGEFKYYLTLKSTTQFWINSIDQELLYHSKPTKKAKKIKDNLKMLYHELQDLEVWDKPQEKI